MAAEPQTKPQNPTYEILYHPSIPGRAEFIRLALEATQTPYTELANASAEGYSLVQKLCTTPTASPPSPSHAPIFAPPALRVNGEQIIAQTPNILFYLGGKLGLAGEKEEEKFLVQQLALTALDLNNEVHDTHHPIAPMRYYEEQKDAALLKARDVRENRIPKYLRYFEAQLRWNAERRGSGGGKGEVLVGEGLTYADTTVWQVLDGLLFAFPREMEVRRREFAALFGFYEGMKAREWLRAYLGSGRRLPYSQGVFRYYPELDRE